MKVHRVTEHETIIQAEVVEALRSLGNESVDMVFADPPYFLQLENELRRPDDSIVSPVDDEWDRFPSFESYDSFTGSWLSECRRVMKREATIWVIGTYHNIFRVGKVLQDLGFWILNDVVWVKSNPMPNFRGTRFTNAHETLIWAKKSKDSDYRFNYWDMKSMNGGLQMRSDWLLPLCSGRERVKEEGKRAHSTQKPLSLLYRVILSCTVPGSMVLDPFLGSGTTAVAARTLGRGWIGVEKDEHYIKVAADRLSSTVEADASAREKALMPFPSRRHEARVSFGNMLESGLIRAGDIIYSGDASISARVNADGSITYGDSRGSIHQICAVLLGRERANGWDYWHYMDGGELVSIELLRKRYRALAAARDRHDGSSDERRGAMREANA